MNIDWKINNDFDSLDFFLALKRCKRFLKTQGLRSSTIELYAQYAKMYIGFSEKQKPTIKDLEQFRDHLFDWHLKGGMINNISFSIQKCHEMLGRSVNLTIQKKK